MKVRISSKEGAYMPEYATTGSAGMDIRAFIKEPLVLDPMDRVLVPTGLYIELPDGYEAQIRARSGLAVKHGITLTNAVGTIDSDYRGEIKISLINLGKENFQINNGDRIAQMIVAKYESLDWEICAELEDTKRGKGGFGHTGRD